MTTGGPRFFYGWVVVAGMFVIMTMGSGFAFYAQGVFIDALVDEQGFSTGMAGLGTGVFFVASGIGGYYTGGLINRFDVRRVMTVGAFGSGAGLYLVGEIRTEWQMLVVMAVFGAGYSLVGLVPATSVVTRWFHRKRSVALSIASTGLSAGGIVSAQFIGRVVNEDSLVEWAPRFGLVFILGTLPFLWLLVRPWPESMGLQPDGDPSSAEAQAAGPPPGTPFGTAVRTRYFKFVSAGFVMIMGAQVGAIQHIYKLTGDRVDIDAAALALMVVVITSVIARIVGGLVTLRVSLHRITTVLVVVEAVGIALIANAFNTAAILVGVIVLGSAMGNLLMLHPLLLANAFGVREYPRIYGLGSLLMIVGVGGGPAVVGFLHDVTDYRWAFLAMAAFALVGGIVYLMAGPAPPIDGAPVTIDLRDRKRRAAAIDPKVFDVVPCETAESRPVETVP